MSGGFQVDMDALERVGRGYQLAAGQLREVLGGLDAQVGALGDAMGIGGATASYERMWSAWRGALGGLCTELDAQVARLLHAVASYDAADDQDTFTGVRNRVKGHGP
ncbi:MAG TPA: WXG100 family type VII secretion target [Actinomycetes bacterium]